MPKFVIGERQRGRAFAKLLILTIALVVALIIVQPWLRTTFGPVITYAIGVVLALGVMGYGVHFAVSWQRGLDEVEVAASGFATTWGVVGRQCLFAVALMFPPFHSFAADVVERFATGQGAVVDPRVVTLAMVFAFGSIALLQGVAVLVAQTIWVVSKR